MKTLYFTSTGNSLYVARTIGGTLLSIPQLIRNNEFEFKDDIVGFVYPCYGFGLPEIVKRFIEKVKIEAEYTFAVTTYGNRDSASLDVMAKTAAKSGIRFDYLNSIKMVDNYLPMFEIGEQIAKIPGKNIEGTLEKIVSDVSSRKKFRPSPGIRSKVATRFVQSAFKIMGDLDRKYIVDDKCNRCGTCAKVCPVGNIRIGDSVEFLHHCECCAGCIHACPRVAIHLKNEKSSARFINENVSLGDIIDSNFQPE
jgi:ferredoxin